MAHETSHQGPEKDEHWDKYRVFYEPEDAHTHPVPLDNPIYENKKGMLRAALEVEGYYFVLRPAGDEYARKALARYAEVCEATHPRLATDLREILEDLS